jgi:hypothetical protein
MEINDPKIVALQLKVTAAQQEFDWAIAFHEVWKPPAYDRDLHSRLGKSLATQAFRVTRSALRREMILALMRLWDKDRRAIGMESVWATLRDGEVVDALALDRARRLGLLDAFKAMRDDLGMKADNVLSLVGKYMKGGRSEGVLKRLRALRHERLAHRQVEPATARGADTTDDEIEEFYQDNSKLIQTLLSLVNAMAYDPSGTASVFGRYASSFWARISEE